MGLEKIIILPYGYKTPMQAATIIAIFLIIVILGVVGGLAYVYIYLEKTNTHSNDGGDTYTDTYTDTDTDTDSDTDYSDLKEYSECPYLSRTACISSSICDISMSGICLSRSFPIIKGSDKIDSTISISRTCVDKIYGGCESLSTGSKKCGNYFEVEDAKNHTKWDENQEQEEEDMSECGFNSEYVNFGYKGATLLYNYEKLICAPASKIRFNNKSLFGFIPQGVSIANIFVEETTNTVQYYVFAGYYKQSEDFVDEDGVVIGYGSELDPLDRDSGIIFINPETHDIYYCELSYATGEKPHLGGITCFNNNGKNYIMFSNTNKEFEIFAIKNDMSEIVFVHTIDHSSIGNVSCISNYTVDDTIYICTACHVQATGDNDKVEGKHINIFAIFDAIGEFIQELNIFKFQSSVPTKTSYENDVSDINHTSSYQADQIQGILIHPDTEDIENPIFLFSRSYGDTESSIQRWNSASNTGVYKTLAEFPLGAQDIEFINNDTILTISESGADYYQNRLELLTDKKPWGTFFPFIYKMDIRNMSNSILYKKSSAETDFKIFSEQTIDMGNTITAINFPIINGNLYFMRKYNTDYWYEKIEENGLGNTKKVENSYSRHRIGREVCDAGTSNIVGYGYAGFCPAQPEDHWRNIVDFAVTFRDTLVLYSVAGSRAGIKWWIDPVNKIKVCKNPLNYLLRTQDDVDETWSNHYRSPEQSALSYSTKLDEDRDSDTENQYGWARQEDCDADDPDCRWPINHPACAGVAGLGMSGENMDPKETRVHYTCNGGVAIGDGGYPLSYPVSDPAEDLEGGETAWYMTLSEDDDGINMFGDDGDNIKTSKIVYYPRPQAQCAEKKILRDEDDEYTMGNYEGDVEGEGGLWQEPDSYGRVANPNSDCLKVVVHLKASSDLLLFVYSQGQVIITPYPDNGLSTSVIFNTANICTAIPGQDRDTTCDNIDSWSMGDTFYGIRGTYILTTTTIAGSDWHEFYREVELDRNKIYVKRHDYDSNVHYLETYEFNSEKTDAFYNVDEGAGAAESRVQKNLLMDEYGISSCRIPAGIDLWQVANGTLYYTKFSDNNIASTKVYPREDTKLYSMDLDESNQPWRPYDGEVMYDDPDQDWVEGNWNAWNLPSEEKIHKEYDTAIKILRTHVTADGEEYLYVKLHCY